jgi:hypothetical protein
MKKMVIVVLALLVAILIVPRANAAEAKKAEARKASATPQPILVAGKKDSVRPNENAWAFARRVGITNEKLVEYNPELAGPRNVRGVTTIAYQVVEGEELYIESETINLEPVKLEVNFSPLATAPTIPTIKDGLHMGLGIGMGNSNKSDYIYFGLYPEIPIWSGRNLRLGFGMGFSHFQSTDRDFLASGDTFRYEGGPVLKIKNHFSLQAKAGQDYDHGKGLNDGANLALVLQGGFWRIWNEAEGNTCTDAWPFWVRDRGKFNLLHVSNLDFYVGGEYLNFGWKDEDPQTPETGYYYTRRGGGFFQMEKSESFSILIGGGSSGERGSYYVNGELTFRIF